MAERTPITEATAQEIDIFTDATPLLDIASALCEMPGYATSLTKTQFQEVLLREWRKLEEKISELNTEIKPATPSNPTTLSPNLKLIERTLRQNDTGAWVGQEFGKDHSIHITYKTDPNGTRLKTFHAQEHVPGKDNLSYTVRNLGISLNKDEFEIQISERVHNYYSNFKPASNTPPENPVSEIIA